MINAFAVNAFAVNAFAVNAFVINDDERGLGDYTGVAHGSSAHSVTKNGCNLTDIAYVYDNIAKIRPIPI